MTPNHSLQRARPPGSGCNPTRSWARSLALGRAPISFVARPLTGLGGDCLASGIRHPASDITMIQSAITVSLVTGAWFVWAGRQDEQPGGLPAISRGSRSAERDDTPGTRRVRNTTLKGSQPRCHSRPHGWHPFRVLELSVQMSGGVAALNPRLIAGNLSGCFTVHHPALVRYGRLPERSAASHRPSGIRYQESGI